MKRIVPSKALTAIMLAAVCYCSLSRGGELQATEAPFKKGDHVAFIGDSITAWGQYTAIIQLFCQTRYPDQEFNIYNNALAGDRALYTRLLEEDGLEEAIGTSIREAEALNDQAYEASIPKTRTYELTRNEE